MNKYLEKIANEHPFITKLQKDLKFKVQKDDTFNSHKFDSLDHIHVVMAAEDHYGKDISDELASSFRTPRDIINHFEKKH